MSRWFFFIKQIIAGNGVTRAYLNERLYKEVLSGKVIDIGGGKNASYLASMPKAPDTEFRTFDIKSGDISIDFETDTLPAVDGFYDTVLFLNVLEHIFNYQHIIDEVVRITKSDGKVIGFVPFLMWYHPDHSDYFRYTHEALEKIFVANRHVSYTIEPIARGPFTAAAQMILFSTPRVVRAFVYTPFHILDTLFLWMRPTHGERYVLGYYFVLTKNKNKSS